MGSSTVTSHVITRLELMPLVISESDTSRLVKIIIHTAIFLNLTSENLQVTMHGVPRMCEVIIELYRIKSCPCYHIHNRMVYKLKNGAHAYAHMLLPCHVIIITKLYNHVKSLSLHLNKVVRIHST